MRVYYFGCMSDIGHFLYDENGRYVYRKCTDKPELSHSLDGGYWPKDKGQPQSVGALSYENNWSILSCWDRSIDSRYGSHSTFIIEGTHTFDEILVAIKKHFPQVMARMEALAPIRLE